MSKFKKGDIVFHRTNYVQRLIIVVDYGDQIYKCRWVDPNGRVHIHEFFEEELQQWRLRYVMER